MSVYKLFPKNGSVNAAVAAQKKTIISQLNQKKYEKNTVALEKALNDFFYMKTGDNYEQYYTRASNLASEAFNERYQNYPFELSMDKMTAKFSNPNISFLKQETATLEKAKDLAKEITSYMDRVNIKNEKWQEILAKIEQLQSLSNWNDVKDLNGIVASILFGNKTVYGDAFEYPLAAFGALLNQGAEATEDELLIDFGKRLQGANRSKSYIDVSHISKSDKQNLQIKNSVILNEGTRLEYSNPTQDKVDVQLTFQGENYNISAKSYSSIYKDIHILGGAPLTAPVLNLSTVDFVNQYLTNLYIDGDLNSLHEAVRLNILFMSLTGTGSSIVSADTFIINDKGNRKIYVRTMPDIVNHIANKNQWHYVDINGNGAEIPDDPLRNYQILRAKNNVASMISLMHTIKLSVSIKGSAIRDATSLT